MGHHLNMSNGERIVAGTCECCPPWYMGNVHHVSCTRPGGEIAMLRQHHGLPVLPPGDYSSSATQDPIAAELEEVGRATGVTPNDPVNPKHYQGDLVMRIIEHFGLETSFYLANLIKYVLRHGKKAGLEDLKKARWYLDRAIARAEGKHMDGVK